MPDWNPDKERHRKHKWVVHNATRSKIKSVATSKGDLALNKEGRCVVTDETIANEIRTSEAGKRDICVTRITADDPADQGHRYHFGQFPGLPWAKYDELGRRIPDDAPQEVEDGSSEPERTEHSCIGRDSRGAGERGGEWVAEGESPDDQHRPGVRRQRRQRRRKQQ